MYNYALYEDDAVGIQDTLVKYIETKRDAPLKLRQLKKLTDAPYRNRARTRLETPWSTEMTEVSLPVSGNILSEAKTLDNHFAQFTAASKRK